MFVPDQYASRKVNRPLSIRFITHEYEEIKNIADKLGISFNALILACCSYSLENVVNTSFSSDKIQQEPINISFSPSKYFRKAEHKQVTVRFTDELFDQINVMSDQWNMAANQFVLACCRYAMENMSKDIEK